jgi:hypothetical protein
MGVKKVGLRTHYGLSRRLEHRNKRREGRRGGKTKASRSPGVPDIKTSAEKKQKLCLPKA